MFKKNISQTVVVLLISFFLLQGAPLAFAAIPDGNDPSPIVPSGNDPSLTIPDGNDPSPVIIPDGNDPSPVIPDGNDPSPVIPDGNDPDPVVIPTPTPTPVVVIPVTPGGGGTTVIYTSNNSGGGSSSYNYQPPSVDIKVGMSNGPVTVAYNSSIYLNWSASNVNACYAGDGWTGYKADFGSEKIENLNASKKYTITCSGQLGSVSDSVIVNVAEFLPKLGVEKSVRNVSTNTPWQEMVYAFPSEALSFQIKVKSNDTQTIHNVKFSDLLPSGLIYQGNLRINDSNVSGDLSELSLSLFNPGEEKIVTFDAKVATKDQFGFGLTSLENKAILKADNLDEASDIATIKVNNPSGAVILGVTKLGKNLSKNDLEWVNEINAEPGDTLEFQISVINNGGATASGFKLKDMLPATIKYAGNLQINGISSDKDITFEMDLGEFQPAETKIISFRAEVLGADKFKYGVTGHLNTAMVFGNDFSNFATTKVNVTRKGVAGATDIITGINVVYLALAIAFILTILVYSLTLYLGSSQRPFIKKLMGAYYKIGSFISR